MSTPDNTVEIRVGSRDNTETGFARVRRSVRDLSRSIDQNLGESGRRSGVSFLQRFGNIFREGGRTFRDSGRGAGESLLSGITGTVAAGMRTVGQTAGSLMSEGIGTSLRSAGSNPYVAAGVAALVATLIPALGTAIGGALILGIGGGLTGVGLMFAAKAKEVQKEFKTTGEVINKVMTDAAKPLVPVLTKALETAQKLIKEFGPILEDVFGDIAPHLTEFVEHLADGFRELKPAVDPIMEAFGLMLDAIGPELEEFFKELGTSLRFLGEEFKKKDTVANFVDMLNLVLEVIPIAVVSIALLAGGMRLAREAARSASRAIGSLIKWIAGIKDRTVRIGQRGASDVVAWVRRVISAIGRFVGKTVRIGVAGVTGAISAVSRLINRIRNLVGKTISISVNFLKGAGSAIADYLGFAHGGIMGAASGGARSNLTLVGEQGPELVNLAPGSRVSSNADSRRMLSEGGRGGPVVLEIKSGGSRMDDLLVEILRKAIGNKGGDVVAVLGR